MCILSRTATPTNPHPLCAAKLLSPAQRQQLALDALSSPNLSQLALQHAVRRKFLRRQRLLASDALQQAFAPPAPPDSNVLFHLPVTRSWLRQFVLLCVLVGHVSFRDTQQILADLTDVSLSIGSTTAQPLHSQQDLSGVRVAALDELFQHSQPVLAVVDTHSHYCCSLTLDQHRDADTWAIRLLDLQSQGFAPLATVADFGTGLRAGVAVALPDVPCRGDLWHALHDIGEVVRYLDHQAYRAIDALDKLWRQKEPDWQRLQEAYQKQQESVRLASGWSCTTSS